MTIIDKPTLEIITATTCRGAVTKARKISAEHGGNFCAPHYTASAAGVVGELAIAAGGVLLLDEPAMFSRATLSILTSTLGMMDLAHRPRVIVILEAGADPAKTLDTFGHRFAGWTITVHHIAKA